jgi:hypothetical protein
VLKSLQVFALDVHNSVCTRSSPGEYHLPVKVFPIRPAVFSKPRNNSSGFVRIGGDLQAGDACVADPGYARRRHAIARCRNRSVEHDLGKCAGPLFITVLQFFVVYLLHRSVWIMLQTKRGYRTMFPNSTHELNECGSGEFMKTLIIGAGALSGIIRAHRNHVRILRGSAFSRSSKKEHEHSGSHARTTVTGRNVCRARGAGDSAEMSQNVCTKGGGIDRSGGQDSVAGDAVADQAHSIKCVLSFGA